MSADGHRRLAFISLLSDDDAARAVVRRLVEVGRRWADAPVFLVPPVRGLDFFASAAEQPGLDHWWGHHVPAAATPVYLLCEERGLAAWLTGLDGVFIVAAQGAAAAEYAPWTVIDCHPEEAAAALAEAAIQRFASREPEASQYRQPGASTERNRDPVAPVALAGGFSRPLLPPLLDMVGEDLSRTAALVVRDHDPLELLVRESAAREGRFARVRMGERHQPSASFVPAPAGARSRFRRTIARPRRSVSTDADLASLLVSRGPSIVVVGSRKGGVGKTSHAAGIAIAAGIALDSIGHRAALLDANIANPDAWGQLDLPSYAATVRDVAAALATGAVPPAPVHAATPGLACYPERRDGVEYSRTDIRRLAVHLRARYTFVMVDMSNRLPDPTGGPEATVAAYWLDEADALVLPTATSRQDFNGVLDYLDVPDLPPTVVPYIVSAARRNRRHPVTREYLEAIAARTDAMVPIPDQADRVRLAAMTGAAVQDMSPSMRVAYRALTEAVARLPARRPR